MVHSTLVTSHLCVCLLGAVHVELNGKSIRFPTQKIRTLLAYLILHPGAHAREKLATLFWGDSPHEEARRSLRQALTILRNNIDKNIVLADRECVRINPAFPLWTDVYEFPNQVQQYMANPASPLEQINFGLYQGDLLPESYDDWILPVREHYHALYIEAMLRAVEQLRTQSEYSLAIDFAQRILACDAANERAHQHLMFCYVTKGDRNKALQQYTICQRALQEELDVEPAHETQVLYHWIKESFTSIPSQAAKITNLPIPISSFVGRTLELAQIKQTLSKARLVTLTGAGGCGKTRLAIHGATDLIDSYKDGVWWVEFAPLADPSLVSHAVAKALGIEVNPQESVTEAIAHYIQKRQLLLVLDNCEHLVSAAAQLAGSLLNGSQGLKILATSREALGVMGEHVWVVPTLSVPEIPEISQVDLVMQYDAVRLFVERASAVKSGFVLSESNAFAIAQVCQRLDGIPLAIELAAARMKMMSAEQIAARLDDRFNLLTTGDRTATERHRTLRATVDWSHDLLCDDERLLFYRLSVFTGGWTLEAAESICSGNGIEMARIVDLMTRLLDKSLISISGSGQRYNMLETIKAYAQEKLAEMGEQDHITQRHLDYFLSMAAIADEKIRGPEQMAWLDQLRLEHDNLTSATRHALAVQGEVEKGVRLVCALAWYWGMVGDFITARYWLEKGLHESVKLGRTASRANILFNVGLASALAIQWLSASEQQAFFEDSLDIWADLGPEYALERAQCQLALGLIRKRDFNDDAGFDMLHESIVTFQACEQSWWHAWALNCSIMMLADAPHQEVYRILEAETALWKESGDRWGLANTLMDSGVLAMNQGDFIEAEEILKESLSIFRELGSKGYIFQLLRHLGTVNRGMNQYEQAVRYYQESIPYAQTLGWDYALSIIHLGLGFVALKRNDPVEAENHLIQSLNVALEHHQKERLVLCIAGFAALAVVRKTPTIAARLFGAYTYHHEASCGPPGTSHLFISPVTLNDIDHYLKRCQEQMEEKEFDQAWNAGHALTLDEVVEEILRKIQ